MSPELVFIDVQPVIDDLVEQAVRAALETASVVRGRRVLVREIMAGTPASEILVSMHKGEK